MNKLFCFLFFVLLFNMSADNFDDHNNENNQYTSIIEESYLFKFNITKNPLIINKIFKELLKELHIILLNVEDYTTNRLEDFIYNFLFEYDLDPKNVFEIMINNSQNIFCYSSLLGFFYQH